MGLFSSSKSKSSSSYSPNTAGAQTQYGAAKTIQIDGGRKSRTNVHITETDHGAVSGAFDLGELSILANASIVDSAMQRTSSLAGSAMNQTSSIASKAIDTAKGMAGDVVDVMREESARDNALVLHVLNQASETQRAAFSEASAVIKANSERVDNLAAADKAAGAKSREFIKDLVSMAQWPVLLLLGGALFVWGKR